VTADARHGALPSRRALLVGGVGAAAALVLPASRPAWSAGDLVVTTRQGRVAGHLDAGVAVFKGIPYGADTRARRFRPPLAHPAWPGVRPAHEYGPSAPQGSSPERMGEDCLCLNVWSPAIGEGKKRAVMVYIHGGAYNNGSGSSPLYDGKALCRRGDVVVVTLNHRLNVFGYLFLQKLGGAAGAAFAGGGNAGQLDLVLALGWVRDNIERFGGDPGCVTLFGQSGGGAKIATLLAMPRARPLFHRAITMSGQQVTASGPNVATLRARTLLDALKLNESELGQLWQLPTEKVLEASRVRDPVLPGSLYFGPVLDDVALPRHPFYPDAPPLSNDVPLLLGNTRDETRTLIGRAHPEYFELGWDGLAGRIAQELWGRTDIDGDRVVREYRRLYPGYTPSEVFFAATSAGRSWRGQVIEAELRADANAPTWVYELNWRSPLDGGKWRAPHTLDIPLAFDNTGAPDALSGNGKAALEMASRVSRVFIAFAKTGDPNLEGLPSWPQYRLDRRATLIFDLPPSVQNDPRGGERRLFATAPYVQPGT
jgi:para-nitrobenzyl esterase